VESTDLSAQAAGLFAKGRRVRTPTLLQMEAVECGAAALGIVLAHFGRYVPLADLRRECGVSRDGVQALHLVKAARRYGLKTRAFQHELEELAGLTLPYIVFWQFNHFLVVEGFRGGWVYVNDPATGPRKVTLRDFNDSFTGIVILLEPGPEFARGGRRPSVARSLRHRLEGSVGTLLFCVLIGFLMVLPGLAIPAFSRVFVDNILIDGMRDWLIPLVLGLALTALLRALLSGIQLKYLRMLKAKLSVSMSSRFMWHLLQLPASFYAQRYAGEVSNRLGLNDRVAGVLSGRLATTVIDLTMILFYAIVMFRYDSVLASIGLAAAAGNLLALHWTTRRRVDANLRLQHAHGKVAGVTIAGLAGIETIKASGLESNFFTRWAGHFAHSVESQQEAALATQRLEVLPSLIASLTSMLILVVGGLRVMNGQFTIGSLVAFQSLMQSFLQPVQNLVGLGKEIQELQGDLNRLDDVLVQPAEASVRNAPSDGDLSRLAGHLELRNVTFGYSRVAAPHVENLSLTVRPGQRVALVGPSGSGKSTVARLIAGLYEPWAGEILFDGKPRAAIPRPVLTSSIAMVDQEILLFAGTVRSNLTLWDPTVTDASVGKACRDASIERDVLSLQGGYDAPLTEGAANLSGGQRQRLEIARSLVNSPAILVLDEATSALDAETERAVDQSLRRRGCTCVLVAHRLSTIRDCDEIVVLDRGRVAERGTHAELLERGGMYASLIQVEGEALESA
jgi:NHLM bacteriocin system ABC transporter peptidase/ATP-binding protein